MSKREKIVVIGYGSQGRGWALNLKDSGCDITVGLPSGKSSRRLAKNDGHASITTTSKAVKTADIIIMAFPDHLHGTVFEKDIRSNLKKNSALVFLHGYSIHFRTIVPPKHYDVILLAPLGPGTAVREKYLVRKPIGYFYSVHQNGSGRAQKRLDLLIKKLRIVKKAMIKTTFADETIGDLFGEQAVLCGGLTQLIKAGYDTLVESGLSSDKAYLEVCYQLDLIVELIKQYGINGMFDRISVAARYGSSLNGPRVIDDHVKKNMKSILKEIESGRFAKRLNTLDDSNMSGLKNKLKKMSSLSFEKSARKFSDKNE